MRVVVVSPNAASPPVDSVVVGVFLDHDLPRQASQDALESLRTSGELRAAFKAITHTHTSGQRLIVAGLGSDADFDAERARVIGAIATAYARRLGSTSLRFEMPDGFSPQHTAATVEGAILADYRFDRFWTRSRDDDPGHPLELLAVKADVDVSAIVADAAVVADAVNSARTLQNSPPNEMTPMRLAAYATEMADKHGNVSCTVEGRDAIVARGMGAFAAVAQGSAEEPALIVLRYDGTDDTRIRLGLVGKGVTFDTGGISLKPGPRMSEQKFDMSGGAAVIAAIDAIARLALPIRVVGVIGATENMPSGSAVKPGDIVRAMNGDTIEINSTDSEGRLLLADCLTFAHELGAEKIIDIATLTHAVIVALGSSYAGVMSNDDDLCAAVERAGRSTGELVWRLPLHPEYADMMRGRYADWDNMPEIHKANGVRAAQLLSNFVGGRPWAHLDIAGVSRDLGRPYAATGGSGFGVRLLVELVRSETPQSTRSTRTSRPR